VVWELPLELVWELPVELVWELPKSGPGITLQLVWELPYRWSGNYPGNEARMFWEQKD